MVSAKQGPRPALELTFSTGDCFYHCLVQAGVVSSVHDARTTIGRYMRTNGPFVVGKLANPVEEGVSIEDVDIVRHDGMEVARTHVNWEGYVENVLTTRVYAHNPEIAVGRPRAFP